VPEDQRGEVSGLPVTTPARTVVDLGLSSDRLTAVATAEWAVRSGHEVSLLTEHLGSRRGAGRLRQWWTYVEPASANRLETCARLHLSDAGLAPTAIQYPVFRGGILIARLDLAYPERKVGVETDGRQPHTEPDQFVWDRRRLIVLNEEGWSMVTFTWSDMRHPAYLAQSVTRALSRAA
jgi:hypothetical protein